MPVNYSEENTDEKRVSMRYEIETYNISSDEDCSFGEADREEATDSSTAQVKMLQLSN